MDNLGIEQWRSSQQAFSEFSVRETTFNRLPEWSLDGGTITHASRGFFSDGHVQPVL